MPRALAFVTVGSCGFAAQIAVLLLLTSVLGWPTAISTAVAVESAVLVNFAWHERWTWRDREAGSRVRRLWRFHLANGLTSIVGNVIITTLAVRKFGVSPALASAGAVAALSGLSFLLADRWVFTVRASAVGAVILAAATPAMAAGPGADTLAAWRQYVAQIERSPAVAERAAATDAPAGRMTSVPGGAIHEWRGSTLIHDTNVKQLVDALIHPGTPPPQDDVLESRVLARRGLTLRVYLKLQRHAVVTATYDTEHEVSFDVQSPTSATSQSIATRIVETDGEDRGFLWRLNSYWRYTQVGTAVRVDVVSLSLSRGVPVLLKPIAGPIVTRVARESMLRTLDAVRRFGESLTKGKSAARVNEQKGTA